MEKTKVQIAADNIVKQFDDERGDYTPPITTFQLKQLLIKSYNTATLKWRKIDPDNLPKGEVIALNADNVMVVGDLELKPDNSISCSDTMAFMTNCTHYIPMSDLLQLPKED